MISDSAAVLPDNAQFVREHDAQGQRPFHSAAPPIRRSFQSGGEARAVLRQVLTAAGLAGLEDRIVLRASAETSGAEAFIEKDERLIVYNAEFMQEVAAKTGSYWSKVAVLAHEVGHHVRFHTAMAGPEHEFELEADYQAGFILRRMGATLAEAQSAFRSIAGEAATKTHPGRAQRVQAVTLGWEEGGVAQRVGRVEPAKPDAPSQAEPPPSPARPAIEAAAQPPPFDARSATLEIQKGLARAGCLAATPTGTWGPQTRSAAQRFGEVSRQAIATDGPTPEAAAILGSVNSRVCPLECRPPQIELYGVCVTAPQPSEPPPAPVAGFPPGKVFRDCPDCPEMVVVPAGEFTMGSTPAEIAALTKDFPGDKEGWNAEGPQRRITIAKPFAFGKFEVTFAEWDACVAAGGCKHKPGDEGWGRGKQPVINVSWDDITREYLPWLSRKVGKTYRLLTEAEWEYAARGGTTTAFSPGKSITTDQANFDGNYTYGGSAKGQYRQRNVDVGSFNANAFGLHDMHGNVWEWVEDCYHKTYQGAPIDGSAWTSAACDKTSDNASSLRVLRGGSWNDGPQGLRSAIRYRLHPTYRGRLVGFRLARAL